MANTILPAIVRGLKIVGSVSHAQVAIDNDNLAGDSDHPSLCIDLIRHNENSDHWQIRSGAGGNASEFCYCLDDDNNGHQSDNNRNAIISFWGRFRSGKVFRLISHIRLGNRTGGVVNYNAGKNKSLISEYQKVYQQVLKHVFPFVDSIGIF